LLTTYNILSNNLLSRLIPYADEIFGDHKCGFEVRGQRLIRFSTCQTLKKKCECNVAVYQLLIDFKEAYVSVRREALHSNLIEFGYSGN
jgi:hypothetical protein